MIDFQGSLDSLMWLIMQEMEVAGSGKDRIACVGALVTRLSYCWAHNLNVIRLDGARKTPTWMKD